MSFTVIKLDINFVWKLYIIWQLITDIISRDYVNFEVYFIIVNAVID